MRIPEDRIDAVRTAADIVSVVQEYVTLRKRGQNYFGICPFHEEKTPSFSVHPGRQIFHCFGCGKGGNVISFLMEIERISFVEAVQRLAEKFGIPLPVVQDEGEGPSESELLTRANGLAKDYFHRQLKQAGTPGARAAREYLKSRRYTDEVVDRFTLGYAPDGWENLAAEARKSGLSQGTFLKAGLLKEGKERGKPYDTFRHRLIFPIRNLSGRVIGFGGRRLREETEGPDSAKYINSPETAVYRKGRELYGLWEARNEIRRRELAVIVEGYTDAVSLTTADVDIVVASLGTSLTDGQAALLHRFTEHAVLMYDSDEAGLAAARRAVDVLVEAGITPRIVILPEGDDPDSYVQREGGEAVWKQINEAKSAVDFQLLLAERRKTPPAKAAKELVATAAKIRSPIEQELFLKETAEKTGISLDSLLRELPRRRTATMRSGTDREAWPRETVETYLTRVLIRQPGIREEIFEEWSPEDMSDRKLKEIVTVLHAQWNEGQHREPETLLDRFPDAPERDFISSCLSDEQNGDDPKQLDLDRREARDCLRRMELDRVKAEIAVVKREMAKEPDKLDLMTRIRTLTEKQEKLKTELRSPN